MGILKELGLLTKESTSESALIFESLQKKGRKNVPFIDVNYCSPFEYIQMYWKSYQEVLPKIIEKKTKEKRKKAKGRKVGKYSPNALNGKIFELIILTLLYREEILPFYAQANVAFVPNCDFDIVFYTSQFFPLNLSLKTSLRERIKQADLESVSLKYVHRRAECFLLTLESGEATKAKEAIITDQYLGIDRIIDCNLEDDVNWMFNHLKNYQYIKSDLKPVITGQLIEHGTCR